MDLKLFPVLIIFFLSSGLICQEYNSRGLSRITEKNINQETGNKGKRYAVCIGINEYEHNEIQDLAKARSDATALGDIFRKEGQFDQVFVMTDSVDPRYDEMRLYPRLRNIKGRLEYLEDFITPDDLVVLSFSGHGISNSDGDGFLIVSDTDYNDVFNTSIPIGDIISWIDRMKVRKSLLLIDACREQVTEVKSRSLSSNKLHTERFDQSQVGAIFYATKTGWYSYEDRESDYGVFTRFLLEGIKGKADYQFGNRDSIVTFKELSSFVEESVGNYSMRLGLKQKPFTDFHGELSGDLAISSYTATVNLQTRGASKSPVPENRNVFGSLAIYSNVDGEIKIDGEENGLIEKGETIIVEDLYEGDHFIEILHEYGLFRNEFTVIEDNETTLSNIIVLTGKEIKNINGINFVYIEGSPEIPGFWISETEISLGHFAEFVEKSGYATINEWDKNFKANYDYYPVHNVSRIDCMEFIKWFSRRFRIKVSLPSVQQWQYVAGGKNRSVYPWGDYWENTYCQNKNSQTKGVLPIIGEAGPIQIQFFQKDITLDGVTNLAGNVREWCIDQRVNSEGGTIGTIAGGSWKQSRARYFKSTYTSSKPVHQASEDLGFRLILQ